MDKTVAQTLNEFNDFIVKASSDEITAHIESCMKAFSACQMPTKAMVDEIVLLSLAMDKPYQFTLLVGTYLQKLKSLSLKEGYHLSGYARMLTHSLAIHDKLDLSKVSIEAVSCAFIKLWSEFSLDNQSQSDIDDGLWALSRVLVALERSGTVLSGEWLSQQGDKNVGTLNKLVSAYKKSINERRYGGEAQAWTLALIEQVMLRLTERSAGKVLQESRKQLGKSAGHVLSALGSGISGLATPFFIGTVGAVPGLIRGLISAGKSALPWAEWAKTKFDKKSWYQELTDLQLDLQLAAWDALQGDADGSNKSPLVEGLLAVFANPDVWGRWQVQAGVCEVLETIALATQGSQKPVGQLSAAQMADVQQIALSGLVHIFRHSKKLKARVVALDRLMVLHGSGGALAEAVLATLSQQLFPENSVALPALSQGDAVFMSERQILTLELADGGISIVTPWLVELALMQNRETSALLAQELTGYVKHEKNKQLRAVPLLAIQNLLRINARYNDLNIEETLANRLGKHYTKYLKEGEIYDDHFSLVNWLDVAWKDVDARLVMAEQTSEVLPLWQLCQEKPANQTFGEYIDSRFTLVKVGQGGLLTDAKTEEMMGLSLKLAAGMKEIHPEPSSGVSSKNINTDITALDVYGGGAAHVTDSEFFINAARGLVTLVQALAPDKEMRNIQEISAVCDNKKPAIPSPLGSVSGQGMFSQAGRVQDNAGQVDQSFSGEGAGLGKS